MEKWLVSKCLLGEKCRYDGRTLDSVAIQRFLKSRNADIVPVCPECDCGLPCPRPPMIVIDNSGGTRLVEENGNDHTLQMTRWIDRRLDELEQTPPLNGAILKSRSPSCGFGTLQITGREHPDSGLFADALHRRFPNLTILSERDIPGAFTPPEPEKLLEKVTECVQKLLTHTPACHDWDHTLRVTNNACALMERTTAAFNPLVVKVAALMHDIGRPRELADCGKTNHAVYGAALAAEWLRAIGVTDETFITAVTDCIRSHRFRKRDGGAEPATLEQKLVYDADKLDSIGAIGIGRSFHFAGRTGARVHNRDDEALSGQSYDREDTAYREYLVKLRHVMDAMLTPAGREIAQHRHQFMVDFFDELNRECFGAL